MLEKVNIDEYMGDMKTTAENITTKWSDEEYTPLISELKTADKLACAGLITSVKFMKLNGIDVRDVCIQNIAMNVRY